MARCILVHRYKCRNAPTLLEDFSNSVSRSLWRDHADVNTFGRDDLTEPNVEPVREHQRLARTEVALDVIAIQSRLPRIGSEDHDDLRLLGCVVYCRHSESSFLHGITTS